MAAPLTCQILTDPVVIVWDNGATFDGELVFTMNATEPRLKNSAIALKIPVITRIPIVNGLLDTDTRIFYGSEINPPGRLYDVTLTNPNIVTVTVATSLLLNTPTNTLPIADVVIP